MYDREDACDGAGGNPSPTKSTSSADRFGNPCGPGSRLFTMDYADTATIGDDKEPYDGSPYWDVVLGGDNLPIPIHVPTSGCIFKFGGFEAQPVIVQSALTQSAAWKDFKTFNAFTAEQADSTFAMGRHWSDTDGDRHISKLPQGPLYQEWGMESVEPWWRTVGKNYDGTDRVALSNPGGFDWTDHGDTILFDNAAENGEVYAPIPCHFICLKPGNTYKITLYATVEPQFGPVCDPDHTIEYVFDSWGPCTFNLPIGDGTTTSLSPIATSGDGWYEVNLWTIPDQSENDSNSPQNPTIYGWNEIPQGSDFDSMYPQGKWLQPYNPAICGIGPIGASYIPLEWDADDYGGDEDDDLIAQEHCLCSLQYTFKKSDWTQNYDNVMGNNFKFGGEAATGSSDGEPPDYPRWGTSIKIENTVDISRLNGKYFTIIDNTPDTPITKTFTFDDSVNTVTDNTIGLLGIADDDELVMDQIVAAIEWSIANQYLRIRIKWQENDYETTGDSFISLQQLDVGTGGNTVIANDINVLDGYCWDFTRGSNGLAHRAIYPYQGSETPEWDGVYDEVQEQHHHEWKNGGGVGDSYKQYAVRTNGKYKSNTFLYTPTSEGTSAAPGDSWIGVYYDANWWGDAVNWHMSWSEYLGRSWNQGELAVGTLPCFPSDPTDYYGVNDTFKEYGGYGEQDWTDNRGGGLIIELVEQG